MSRAAGLALALLAGCASAAPRVEIDAAPPPSGSASAAAQQAPTPTPAEAAPSLLGTTWSGATSDGDAYTFEFRAGGRLHYTSPSGTFDNGTWTQDGTDVSFEMNGHYSDYTGTLHGDELRGAGRNRVGRSWTWSVTRTR